MATLEVTGGSREEVDITATANADAAGDDWLNTGRERLLVVNDDDAPHSVTIPRTRKVDGQSAADLVVEVPAESSVLIRKLEPRDYNDEEGSVSVSYDDVTDGEDPPAQVLFVKLIRP
jgi:hypothetical protein